MWSATPRHRRGRGIGLAERFVNPSEVVVRLTCPGQFEAREIDEHRWWSLAGAVLDRGGHGEPADELCVTYGLVPRTEDFGRRADHAVIEVAEPPAVSLRELLDREAGT